jgi:predicted ArsR family transcriptional regulator
MKQLTKQAISPDWQTVDYYMQLLGLTRTAAREHLERAVRDGLAVRRRLSTGRRGRPPILYRRLDDVV